jgi:predicted DsbA family dithiol-disulfide isomerase
MNTTHTDTASQSGNAGSALTLDFVSDIACPWCAVGLAALEKAIASVNGELKVDLRFQPFELNPAMPPEGEDITEHLARKYQITPAQIEQNQQHLYQRGAEAGFTFTPGARKRIYNTFDAHRLLHWAAETAGAEAQHRLKRALLKAYFIDGLDPSDPAVLRDAAIAAGLDGAQVASIIAGDEHAEAVRAQEKFYLDQGIHSVPSVIINGRYLVQGGQPAEVFEQALRQIAAESGAGSAVGSTAATGA